MVEKLWFDVGIKRYTTSPSVSHPCRELWFDVGIKRYTTHNSEELTVNGCGLM